jgi:transposase-like protein
MIVKPKKKCCKSPDVKNEGGWQAGDSKIWEYHCFNCNKTWNEKEK